MIEILIVAALGFLLFGRWGCQTIFMLILLIPFFFKWPVPTSTITGSFFGYSIASRLMGVPFDRVGELDYDKPRDATRGTVILLGAIAGGIASYLYAKQNL
jgi:hypothetical protein